MTNPILVVRWSSISIADHFSEVGLSENSANWVSTSQRSTNQIHHETLSLNELSLSLTTSAQQQLQAWPICASWLKIRPLLETK